VLAPLEASRLLAGLVNLGLVGGPASVEGGSQSTAPGVSASAAGSGSLEIRARGRSAGEAEAQANAVAADVSSVVGQMSARAAGAGELVLGDFEHGTGGWGGVSSFSTAPAAVTLDRQAPRFGTADLVVGCGVVSGCGITDNVTYAFAAHVTYTASAWVRAVAGPLFITLILGRGVDDYAETRPVAVGSAWQRVSLAWSPRTASSAAELDVQRVAGTGTTFAADGVGLRDPTAPTSRPVLGALSPRAEAALFASAREATVVPARAGGVEAPRTLAWAGGGLLAGLLLGLAAVGGGRAAAGREQEPEHQPVGRA
jgi:hypothetical protein